MIKKMSLAINGQNYDHKAFIIGLSLAISSSIFIGSSFIIKKLALRRIGGVGSLRASDGGFGYLKEWLWWLGLLTMGAGEAANLVAYGFAPAALVTPLGALSVLVAAVLASRFLREKLNFLGKLGCFLCVIGSTVIVIHSPKEQEIHSFSKLTEKLQEPLFICYVVIVLLIFLSITCYFGPRHGSTNIIVYLLLCSAVGSLTVVCCKGVALGIKEILTRTVIDFNVWVFWGMLLAAVLCICVQMNYLNKSLDIFNTSLVTPVYYVMFTILVIVASAILFREWQFMEFTDVLGSLCGFVIIITAIFMLNAFKDIDFSFQDININTRRKRDNSFSDDLEDEHTPNNGIGVIYGTSRQVRNI